MRVMRKAEKWSGIEAMTHEGGDLPKQAHINIRNSARGLWQWKPISILLTVVFSLSDAVMLYSVMDVALTQAWWMGYAASFIIALFLNFIPVCMAVSVHHAIYRTRRRMWVCTAALMMAFTLVFAITLYLRFAYKDLYGDLNTMQLSNTLSDVEVFTETDPGKNTRSTAVVLLTAFAPLGTSVLNFIMAFLSHDPVQKEADAITRRIIELNEAIGEVQAGLDTMTNLERDLLEQDEREYAAMRMSLIERAKFLRAYGVQLLEESLGGNPSAISKLSDEIMPENCAFEEALNELETEGNFNMDKIRSYPFDRAREEEEKGLSLSAVG